MLNFLDRLLSPKPQPKLTGADAARLVDKLGFKLAAQYLLVAR